MIIHGSSAWNLISSLTNFDDYKGEQVTTEIWGGLYSDRESQFAVLKERGAKTITPQKAGPLCYLTATFLAASGGSGGGGGGSYVTIRWDTDADVLDIDLARIRTWGTDGSPLSTDNKERARRLALIDQYVNKGDIKPIYDSTVLTDAQKTYGLLKASGITGAMRATYVINKTTTWERRADIDAYIDYAKTWKVVAFSATEFPYKEPKYRDVNTSGAWETVSMKWLTMPPRTSSQTRMHTLYQSWLGAVEWKGDLYDNG